MPVALPPGRARLETRPSLTGSWPTPKTIGIIVLAALAASAGALESATITATRRRTRSAMSTRQTIVLAIQPVVLNHYVLALDVAGFAERFSECSGLAHGGLG